MEADKCPDCGADKASVEQRNCLNCHGGACHGCNALRTDLHTPSICFIHGWVVCEDCEREGAGCVEHQEGYGECSDRTSKPHLGIVQCRWCLMPLCEQHWVLTDEVDFYCHDCAPCSACGIPGPQHGCAPGRCDRCEAFNAFCCCEGGPFHSDDIQTRIQSLTLA